jgi:enterochelin esterase family protein
MKKIILVYILFANTIICLAQDSIYHLGSDSKRKEGVPKGSVTKYEWQSKLYNNFREFYVYIPVQYDSTKPAALMVFQDGHAYVNDSGDFRVPLVYDNLIYQNKLPVTICLFVNPGHNTKDYPESRFRASNRADEYDVLDDRYTTMLMDEIIPELKKKYNISNDPKMHGIGGLSSGAICAFTAAWEHPEYFNKVLSQIGSYTNIRGGNNYPSIIRKHKKKDIKIFMQDGSNDLNNEHGDWWLANLEMESALKFKGYEFRFEKGSGTHSGKHGGAILPESLIWLWSDIKIK